MARREAGITVGIPAFNARKTLERALDSALAQTVRTPFEILVVDDGSTDTTANIALSYALMFPEVVRLIRTSNRGVAAARNEIVRSARYEYLTWLDADDYYLPEKLELQHDALVFQNMLKRAALPNPNVIVFSAFSIAKQTYSFSEFLTDPVPRILNGDFRAYLWASMTTTAAYQEVGPFNESLHRSEDTDWLLRYLFSGQRQIVTTGQSTVMEYHFSTDRNGAAVEHSFNFMLTTYGQEMKRHGIFSEYVPRRWWEISNFYHRNKKWDDMWRCRALAAHYDSKRFAPRLETEIAQLATPEARQRIRTACRQHVDRHLKIVSW